MKIFATLFASTVFAALAGIAHAAAPTATPAAVVAPINGATQLSAAITTGDKPTKVVFNYGLVGALNQTATVYLAATPNTPTATVNVSKLVGNQTYHFNVVVANTDAPAGVTADGTDFAVPAYAPTIARLTPITDPSGTATLRATVIPNGTPITDIQFDYGTGSGTTYTTTVPGNPATVADGTLTTPTTITAALAGLAVGEQYHYRVRATNGAGETTSPDYLFNTAVNNPNATVVETGKNQIDASYKTENAAKTATYNYGIAGGPLSTKATVTLQTTAAVQTSPISLGGLVGGQTYHFNIVLANPTEPANPVTADGVDFFVPAYAPTVLRNAHVVRADGTATLKATITPNGAPVSAIKFEYGTTTSYGLTVLGTPPTIDDGNATTGVASIANISGLTRGQIYHYRISATNNLGTTSTTDATLATAANKAPVARADKVFLQGDKPILISVLANDYDPDKDTITLISVTQGKQGHTEIVGNQVRYTPLPDATGGDTFTYIIRDGFTASPRNATGTVTISAPALAARGLKAAQIKDADGTIVGQIRLFGTGTGQITGKVQFFNDTYTVAGTLDANGRFNYTIPRKGGPPLQLTAEFSDPTKSFQASLTEGSKLYAAEAPAYAITDARRDEIVGKYTVQLPPASATDGSPQGNGFARIEVRPWGEVTIKGQLGDGTKFSTKGVLGGTDTTAGVTMWITPEDSRASAQFTFGSGTAPAVTGEMKWYRSPNDQSNLYPEGFYTTLSPTGAFYVPPEKGERALDTSNSKASITLSDGNLNSNITHNIEISKSDRVTVLNDTGDGFSFKINRENGTFKGYFDHPVDGDQRKFEGVLVQTQGKGSGLFTGIDQAGGVQLTLGTTTTTTGGGNTGGGNTGGNTGGNNAGGNNAGGNNNGGAANNLDVNGDGVVDANDLGGVNVNAGNLLNGQNAVNRQR
jgi:hypothetical protein